MIDGLTLYAGFAGLFGLATVAFLIWTVQHPPGRRRYGLAVVAACLTMAVANALMANEILTTYTDGAAYPHARFLGYYIAFGAICWLLGTVAGAGRKLTAVLTLAIYAQLTSVLASWNLADPAASVASVLVLVSVVAAVAVLLGPINRATAAVSGERRLLYGKLRNLAITVWTILPIVGVMSEQNLAILTSFAGIFLGTYLDLLLLVGVGTLLLRSPAALDQLAGREGGTVTAGSNAGETGSSVEFGASSDD